MHPFWFKLLASGFFLGHSPWIPGTVGSLGGIVLYAVLSFTGVSWPLQILLIVLLFFLGVWVSNHAEKIYGRKDARPIVIDEIVGMMVALIGIPFHWLWILLGFLIFRFFDIVKPAPARSCERLQGGLGIMLDDAVSGIYALFVLHLIIWLFS